MGAGRQIARDARPLLAEARELVEIGGIVAGAVGREGYIGGAGVELAGLDARNPFATGLRGDGGGELLPLLALIVREPEATVVGAGEEPVGLQRRLGERSLRERSGLMTSNCSA